MQLDNGHISKRTFSSRLEGGGRRGEEGGDFTALVKSGCCLRREPSTRTMEKEERFCLSHLGNTDALSVVSHRQTPDVVTLTKGGRGGVAFLPLIFLQDEKNKGLRDKTIRIDPPRRLHG